MRCQVEKQIVMDAVKKLRAALVLTQTQLATKIGRGMSTIQRWEQLVPPQGEALVQLMTLAATHGQNELAQVFRSFLSEQLGYEVPIIPLKGGAVPEGIIPGEAHTIELVKIVLQLAHCGLPDYVRMREQLEDVLRPLAESDAQQNFMTVAVGILLLEVKKRV